MLKSFEYTSEVQSVSSLTTMLIDNEKKKRIDLDPLYQRDIVWNDGESSEYILSVIQGCAPSSLIFNINEDGIKVCIDGKQRCKSLLKFVTNKIPIIIDEIEYYYGPNESDLDKKKKLLEKKLIIKFDDNKLNLVQYKNLTFAEQSEIFNKIQHGKKLTAGELVLSKIKNIDTCEKLKEYCESKYDSLKEHYGKRREHYNFIIELMYLFTEGSKPIVKKNIDKFISNMKDKNITTTSLKINKIIKFLFTKDLFNNPKIMKLKLAKVENVVYCYNIYEQLLKDTDKVSSIQYTKLMTVIANTNKELKDKQKTKQSIINISEVFDKKFDGTFYPKKSNDSDKSDDE